MKVYLNNLKNLGKNERYLVSHNIDKLLILCI